MKRFLLWIRSLFIPRTSGLLAHVETQTGQARFVDLPEVAARIEVSIKDAASRGECLYVVPPGWARYFAKGSPGRWHFEDRGFSVEEFGWYSYAIRWGVR